MTTGARADTGWTRVNGFMSYNTGTKTVRLQLFAAYDTHQGGFNFNGGSNGSHTITVPRGWMVRAHVVNKDAIPHSAIIIKQQTPIPNAPDTPDLALAYTSHVTDGLQPMNGSDDMTFRASPVGSYMLACGVPGHAPSGMWIRFVVSADATAPTYTM
jgi:sulfocyanin